MRAFVTGATGFIGSRVVLELRADGWDVAALVRTPGKASHLRDLGIELVPGDVNDPSGLREAMTGADVVYHLAAYHVMGSRDRETFFKINVEGTRNVLRAAGESSIPRVVYCSSTTALGTGPAGSIGDETRVHDGRFASVYEESKWAAHQAVHRLASEGVPVVTTMPCAVYGPGDPSVLGKIVLMFAHRRIPVFAFRDSVVSWVHVDDIARGMILAAEKGRPGEDYVFGGDNESIRGLLERLSRITAVEAPRVWVPNRVLGAIAPVSSVVARLIGKPPGGLVDVYRMLDGSLAFSSAKAERELGYKYRSIEDGFGAYILEESKS